MNEARRWTQGIPVPLQRSILFVFGLGLVVYEALEVSEVRWHMLIIYAGMMGFPLAQKADEIRDDVRRVLTPPEEP